MKKILFFLLFCAFSGFAQNADSLQIRKIYDEILTNGESYKTLTYLCKTIGPRLSGSAGAAKAVEYTKKVMEDYGFQKVFLQDVMVPHWVRGAKEEAYIENGKVKTKVPVVALGGSVATPVAGVKAEVIQVKNFEELKALGEANIKGKIVLFNRPMDPTRINTFEAYAGAVNQRGAGASEAAKYGAVGAIVRSMTTLQDDNPHTGGMRYAPGIPMIPTAAISTNGANLLSRLLKENPKLKFYFKQNCQTLADAPSHNVVGEIRGTEKPDEIIVVGGHLDSWDLAEGAQDDGSGCVQAIEVLRAMNALGIKPKRTIRAVMFMNEENGLRGGTKYADLAKQNGENHIAAIESDNGGFTPRGFGMVGTTAQIAKVEVYKNLLAPYGLAEIGRGSGGADIGPLGNLGTLLIGFKPDSQRYFDFHHAQNDKLDAVNERELKLGAASMAALVYLIDKYGL
ncbi:M20/M25/M40 family metallo-hydrolase [Emticicia sp. BO119]|uniref:M20/M25/M40 family metallo-hydrolase n=1 Tax=Emticicia sp. BO119 TaxID=2757768 RepID=UPI0015F10808|nr:M20/M25/M40 family metallo-hydrolase [Emticicia sp. BO119]MBA4852606.1 M20/M25/M40 family metallo-hydrolase [Emticicia sp. BO119]